MCQQDTKAAKSCTNRCPNRKKLKQIQKMATEFTFETGSRTDEL